jgi:transcriptional regulator with XRE-family HTH domain
MNLGILLGIIRNNRGLKQIYVAEKCNLSQAQLSLIEKGKRKLTNEDFIKICAVLGLKEKEIVLEIIKHLDKNDIKKGKEELFDKIKDDLSYILELLLSDIFTNKAIN